MRKTKRNYVNNHDLFTALVEYQKKCKEAEDSGDDKPRVPNYIGECIQQISNKLATKPNFSGYTFKEDMVMDGIENCLQYMHNFDHNKTQNPFAYFTQIIWFAFLRRIAKEKKQMYIRYKSSHELLSMGGTYDGGDEISIQIGGSPENIEYINNFITDYETKMNKGKKKDPEILDDIDNISFDI
jgi:hypothetical protein